MVLGAVFVLLFIALYIVVRRIESSSSETKAQITTEQYGQVEDPAPALTLTLYGDNYTSDHEFETYLFLGTDYSGNEEATGEDYHGSMADFLNLLIIDHTAQTYSVLEIDRDTITEVTAIDENGERLGTGFFQICSSHWYGGDKAMSCENTVAALAGLLGGLPIDGYFAIPFEVMPEVNHLVGGVTVTIEDDGLTVIDPAFQKGATITLDDEQAAGFVRARMGVGEGTNEERMERQSQYMTAMMEQLKGKLDAEPDLALTLFDSLSSEATTNMNGKTVSRLGNDVLQYTDKGKYRFEGSHEVGQALEDGLDHDEFYPDSESLTAVLTDLFSLTFQE
jgi:LCP family protein required for cell wall assembly